VRKERGREFTHRYGLDSPLEAAVSLYRKLGFEEIEPYYHNPFDNVIYFGIDL